MIDYFDGLMIDRSTDSMGVPDSSQCYLQRKLRACEFRASCLSHTS